MAEDIAYTLYYHVFETIASPPGIMSGLTVRGTRWDDNKPPCFNSSSRHNPVLSVLVFGYNASLDLNAPVPSPRARYGRRWVPQKVRPNPGTLGGRNG